MFAMGTATLDGTANVCLLRAQGAGSSGFHIPTTAGKVNGTAGHTGTGTTDQISNYSES